MEHSHTHSRKDDTCCSTDSNSGVRQSLSEMEFERGIWYAAQWNDLSRVRMLLKKGVSANAEDSAGYTALHYAARNGHHEICKILLDHDASANAQTRCGRAAPLHRAAMQGHVGTVELLLKYGANPDLQDADGCTALHKALVSRSINVCKVLIPCTNLTLMAKNKQSVEELAEKNCPEILAFLLRHTNGGEETASGSDLSVL